MNKLILPFLLIALASANTNFLRGSQPQESLTHFHFDPYAFFLGYNQELGIVESQEAGTCFNITVSTDLYLRDVIKEIESLNLEGALKDVPCLISTLQSFSGDCQHVADAYTSYFQTAIEAYNKDKDAYWKTVKDNLIQNKKEALTYTVEIIVAIIDSDDTTAGVNYAKLIKVALKGYLPQ